MKERIFLMFVIFLNSLLLATLYQKNKKQDVESKQEYVQPVDPISPRTPKIPQITETVPAFLEYKEIVKKSEEWMSEAEDFVDIVFYGNSAKGERLLCIKLTNELEKKEKERILITAAIHGNEPWSTGVIMAFVGTVLSEYSKNKELLDNKEIYVIPVVSPDSYPHSRHVDGVDPNRDFPSKQNPNRKSSTSIAELQGFFHKIKPHAVLSGHTYGRVFLVPYGETRENCKEYLEYKKVINKMQESSGYKMIRGCEMYGSPIHGTELDWYHKNGAFSIVVEFGTHQQKPTLEQIKSEFQRTYSSIICFIEEAPKVKIQTNFNS